jgi:hypothetical protein
MLDYYLTGMINKGTRVLTGTSRLIVRHLLHVRNLSHSFLASDFRSTFTLESLFLCLTTLGVGLIETFTKTNGLGIWIAIIATPLDRWLVAERILVGIAEDGSCLKTHMLE